jgi:NADH dehydrogenase [ubiquinone] 1 alpha subcomplex assembly factor 7
VSDRSPLEAEIRRRITTAGPMPLAEYMALCLVDREHGYYTTRDPLGARGDFTTSVCGLRRCGPRWAHRKMYG